MIVPDASVLIKLFKREADSDIARMLVNHVAEASGEWCAPSIIRYEMLAAAVHVGYPFEHVLALFEWFERFGFAEVTPTREDQLLAESIATTPAAAGGYPDLFDSLYHAVALNRGATFVTADRRHIAKTGHRGGVMLLADWKPD